MMLINNSKKLFSLILFFSIAITQNSLIGKDEEHSHKRQNSSKTPDNSNANQYLKYAAIAGGSILTGIIISNLIKRNQIKKLKTKLKETEGKKEKSQDSLKKALILIQAYKEKNITQELCTITAKLEKYQIQDDDDINTQVKKRENQIKDKEMIDNLIARQKELLKQIQEFTSLKF